MALAQSRCARSASTKSSRSCPSPTTLRVAPFCALHSEKIVYSRTCSTLRRVFPAAHRSRETSAHHARPSSVMMLMASAKHALASAPKPSTAPIRTSSFAAAPRQATRPEFQPLLPSRWHDLQLSHGTSGPFRRQRHRKCVCYARVHSGGLHPIRVRIGPNEKSW